MDVCVQAAKQCSGLLKMMMLELMVVVLLKVLKMMMMVLKITMVVSLKGEALFGSLFGIFLNIC